MSLKNHISCDVFVADVAKIKEEWSSESAQLLKELGLRRTKIITPSVRRASAVQLYSSVIEKIAHNKEIEEDKKVKREESIAKKVERLLNTASSWMRRSEFHFLKLWNRKRAKVMASLASLTRILIMELRTQ